ncbi:Uncharacterised protein [Mycobacterium tuberculosis]|nr:Uncharacterised protein [Mycobacterium tuberculosis]
MDNDIVCRAADFMLESDSYPSMRFVSFSEVKGCYGIGKSEECFTAVFFAMKAFC